MSARARVSVIVAVAAALVAAATVGITVLTADGRDGARTRAAPLCPQGPPLDLDLGIRSDREAVALRRGADLYARGARAAARRIFARARSLEGRVAAAVAGGQAGRLAALRRLARSRPRSGVVRLHLGHALACAGDVRRARVEWRAAARVAPDSRYAVRAGDRLHPEYVPGLPGFVPTFGPPAGLQRLSRRAQLGALARMARSRDVRARVLYGIALQRLDRPISARRAFAEAARLAPGNAEAQVAAAVAEFDKERPARAFGRLGPLTRRFPRAATVRFHLGLLLLWIGSVDEGKRQLARARRQEPSSPLAREATAFLRRLEGVGTGSPES